MGDPKKPTETPPLTEDEAALLAEIEAQPRRPERFAWTDDEVLHLDVDGKKIKSDE